ncbi:MAG: hypothetical protein NZ693_00530 [Thermoflexales bacterium]|nr:hypothetical protein [Thermoflexales bacterium]
MSRLFEEKLRAAQARAGCGLSLSLDIAVANTPLPIQPYDEPMLPFARAIIEATADLVCAYALNPAFYLAEGAAGIVAMERIARLIPRGTVLLIDTAFGSDPAAASAFARGAFDQFLADGVTISSCISESTVRCLTRADRALFAVVNDEADLDRVLLLSSERLGLATSVESVHNSVRLRQALAEAPFVLLRAEGCTMEALGACLAYVPPDRAAPIVTVSHQVLYASRREDFAEAARAAALRLRDCLQRVR